MDRTVKVFKFGGAALKDAAALRNVRSILERFRDDKLVIIVSAMAKTTDALERVVEAHARGNGEALSLYQEIKDWHYRMTGELFGSGHEINALINDLFVEADWVLDEAPHEHYDYMYDQIVSLGELVSSRIVAAFLSESGLHAQWLDARDVVITDDLYREGWVQWEETQHRFDRVLKPMLAHDGLVVTQGFIGSTKDNQTTTLGRAGSDYSAAIFSYCLDAQSMTIWKDVPGMLTADPRFFPDAVKLGALSYAETIEMTYYGASVIHLKTIKPLESKGIPLYVKSFIEPDAEGTRISAGIADHYPPMVAVERNQAFLKISTRDYAFVAEHHLADLFRLIADLRLQVNLMQNSAIHFLLCVNDKDDRVDRLVSQIEPDYQVELERDLELITVRHDTPEALEKLSHEGEVLFEKRIPQTVQWVVRKSEVGSRKSEMGFF